MIYAKYAFENGFGVGFRANKDTNQYEWWIKCNKCGITRDLPLYTQTAHKLGLWPWKEGQTRDDSEIQLFFEEHKSC